MITLARSELTKLFTTRAPLILSLTIVLTSWPMAWASAVSGKDLPADSPEFFSSIPIPPEYQGMEIAGWGYPFIVALGALWAGSEYGNGGQLRTTLTATPQRARVFAVKAFVLAALISVVAALTMTGSLVITHASAEVGIDPFALTPRIWASIGGVTLAWTMSALIAFAIGTLARTAIVPLILLVPLVVGVGDFLMGFWEHAKYLPTTAGMGLYSDPTTSGYLDPATAAVVQASWMAILLAAALAVFVRRDL